MAIYLIRHAHAGHRSSWPGDDFDRPLSDKGLRQAERLRDGLAGAGITHVYSSPSARCRETAEPLAALAGVDVVETMALFEGAEAEAAIDFLLDHADEQAAMCSHGDVIPKVIRGLVAKGMRTKDGSTLCSKGSAWVLEVDDGAVVSGRYLPPLG